MSENQPEEQRSAIARGVEPLKIVGDAPTPFEVITRPGVVAALWDILDDAQRENAEDTDDE